MTSSNGGHGAGDSQDPPRILEALIEPPRDRLLEVEHAARRLSVCQETIRSYIRDGLLPALRLPRGTYRIRESALDAFITSLEQQETARLRQKSQTRQR